MTRWGRILVPALMFLSGAMVLAYAATEAGWW